MTYNDKVVSVNDFYFNKNDLVFIGSSNFSYNKLVYPALECKFKTGDYRVFYYKLVKCYMKKYKEWREGQAMYNVLRFHFPDLYEKHSHTDYDCFNNDKNIKEFMKKINKDLISYENNS